MEARSGWNDSRSRKSSRTLSRSRSNARSRLMQQALDAAGVDTLIGHLRNFGGHHLFGLHKSCCRGGKEITSQEVGTDGLD